MVGVVRDDGSAFCIDSREVTNEQYALFLERAPVVELHPKCADSPDRTPKDGWPAGPDRARYPVGAVNWCDAQAFCVAGGKRLCGDAAGDIVNLTYADGNKTEVELDEDTTMEMRVACTGDGATIHPYGNEYREGACPYAQFEATVAADGDSGCEGGYEGIHFLEGNAQEWEGRCRFDISGESQVGAFCTTRGTYACGMNRIDTGNGVGVSDWTRYTGSAAVPMRYRWIDCRHQGANDEASALRHQCRVWVVGGSRSGSLRRRRPCIGHDDACDGSASSASSGASGGASGQGGATGSAGGGLAGAGGVGAGAGGGAGGGIQSSGSGI